MKTTRLLVIAGLAVAAVSANATINLASGATFIVGGVFTGLGAQPTYTPGSSIASLVLNPTKKGFGSINQWWFSAVDTTDLTSVTYQITLTGITSKTKVQGEIQGQTYNSKTGVIGPAMYSNTGNFAFNVDAATGSNAITQTLDFTEYLSNGSNTQFNTFAGAGGPFNTMTAFYKANFTFTNVVPEPTGVAALAIGALGLLIRRRRSN
jgi:hypothetical protein